MAMLPKLSILEMGGRAWPPGTVPTMGPNEQKSTLGQNKAARFERIGIATLNAAGITRSAHATVQAPSSNLHAKSGLNRTSSTPVCGCSPASSTAKPTGSGTTLVQVDTWFPNSKLCSECEAKNTQL